MSGPLILRDYTAVPKENGDFCRSFQEALDNGHIRVEHLLREDEEKREKEERLQIFQANGSEGRTWKYAGSFTWQGQQVMIGSRFDQGDKNWFLAYVIEKAMGIPLHAFPELSSDTGHGTHDLLLAVLYLRQLKDALMQGYYRQYRTFRYNDSSPRGWLDVARHLRLNPMNNGTCAYAAREYTLDNPVNRLILLARRCLIQKGGAVRSLVERTIRQDSDLSAALRQLEWAMGSTMDTPAGKALLYQAGRPIVHPCYGQYEPLRRTSAQIVRRQGLQLLQSGEVPGAGVVIPMDRAWELFLEHAVMGGIPGLKAQQSKPILIPDGGGAGKRTLKPDFLLPRGEGLAVLDAKYKIGWQNAYCTGTWENREDVFQILSYLLCFKAGRGGLIFPAPEEKLSDGPVPQRFWLNGGEPKGQDVWLLPVAIPNSANCRDYGEYVQRLEASCRRTRQSITEQFLG